MAKKVNRTGNRGRPGAGRGGVVPPAEHRFKPGQSGNPGGSRSAGAYLTEWLNALVLATEADLRRIVQDRRAPVLKRSAAERILHALMPPLSAFEGLINGTQTLADLEAAGTDTSMIKKFKERQEYNADGNVVGVTRELELHCLAGEEFDRIADRTEGRPTQKLDVQGASLPAVVEIRFPFMEREGEGRVAGLRCRPEGSC